MKKLHLKSLKSNFKNKKISKIQKNKKIEKN